MVQWTTIGHTVELLHPFEEFPQDFERADASLSLVILAI